MIFSLLGAVVMGLAVAGVLTIVYRAFGRKAPGWLLPLCAGATVLVFIVWQDYTWFVRTEAALPDSFEVAASYGTAQGMRPWTMVAEVTERFVAVDLGSLRTNPQAPGYALANVYFLARYLPTVEASQLYDCDEPRRADLGPSVALGEDGLPPEGAWRGVAADDPVRAVVCAAAGGSHQA